MCFFSNIRIISRYLQGWLGARWQDIIRPHAIRKRSGNYINNRQYYTGTFKKEKQVIFIIFVKRHEIIFICYFYVQIALDTTYWTVFNHITIWGSLVSYFVLDYFYNYVIGGPYVGSLTVALTQATFWFTAVLTVSRRDTRSTHVP